MGVRAGAVVTANEFHSGLARGYLAQPEMHAMIGTALDLGWTLWAYEAQFDITPDADRAWLRSMESTIRRERERAANLGRLLGPAPGEPMLVWRGSSHACKHEPAGCDDDRPAEDLLAEDGA